MAVSKVEKAGKINAMKSVKEKKTNPFEMKCNRKKHNVLGRRMKGETGNVVTSRQKAVQNRMKTLLVEYKKKDKVNNFMDKRFGENNPNLSVEDKLMERFVREKRKAHSSNPQLFSLNDGSSEEEEEALQLTHYGQSLAEIDDFDNRGLGLDDEDEGAPGKGEIEGNIVRGLHFGGGEFEDQMKEFENAAGHNGTPRTKKEIMEEVIAKSKIYKLQRQKELDQVADLTAELDADFNNLIGLLGSHKAQKKPYQEDRVHDDYDTSVRQLRYEIKGRALDRLKTPEEIASEQRKKLEDLEKDRQMRMHGFIDADETDQLPRESSNFSTGDSLEDFQRPQKKSRGELVYDLDGKLNSSSLAPTLEADSMAAKDEDEDDSDQESDSEAESEDSFSDIEMEDDQNEDQGEDEETVAEENANIPLEQQKMMEKAATEVPYTFEAPLTLQDFHQLTLGRDFSQVGTIIQRTIILYNVKLKDSKSDNTMIMTSFLEVLLQYIAQLCDQMTKKETPVQKAREIFAFVNSLASAVFSVAIQIPEMALKYFKTRVDQMHSELDSRLCRKSEKKSDSPPLKDLICLRLLSLIFPESDFWHPITTPAILVLCQYLSQCRMRTPLDLVKGLFCCNLLYRFVREAKRFVPETLCFLSGLLYLLSPSKIYDEMNSDSLCGPQNLNPHQCVTPNICIYSSECRSKLYPNFSVHPQFANPIDFVDCFATDSSSLVPLPQAQHLSSASFRCSLLTSCLRMSKLFCQLHCEIPAFPEMFAPLLFQLKSFDLADFQGPILEELSSLIDEIERNISTCKREPLLMQKHKPVPLQLYTPAFDENYSGRTVDPDKERREFKKLQHKQKKEYRGAVRELRRDNAFLAAHKIQQMKNSDAIRAKKVKSLKDTISREHEEKKQEEKLIRKEKRILKK